MIFGITLKRFFPWQSESPNYIREFKGKESFISGILPDSLKEKFMKATIVSSIT
ncbi:MAG: hypothetical protein AB1397_02240 [bacterium]